VTPGLSHVVQKRKRVLRVRGESQQKEPRDGEVLDLPEIRNLEALGPSYFSVMSLPEWNPGSATTTPSPSGAASSGTATAPPPSAPPSQRPLGRYLWPVIAIVVVLGVIFSLVAAGVFSSGGGSSGGSTPTFLTAYAVAQPSANKVAGGPWDLVAAAGVDSPTSVTTNVSTATSTNCVFSAVPGGTIPSSVTIPAFHGQLSSGGSPFWGMIFVNRASQQVLLVGVQNGTPQALAIGTGSCVQTFGNFTNVPSGIVDSSTAASAAWGDGGSAFVGAHGNLTLTLEMGLIGGGTLLGIPIGATWLISISPCGFSGSGPAGTQPEFTALINAENGNVTLARVTTTTCSSTTTTIPLGSVFTLGNPVLLNPPTSTIGCRTSDYCYNVTIEVAADSLTPNNISFSVRTASGGLLSGVVGFSILTLTGQVLVSASTNPTVFWIPGTGTAQSLLTAGMTVVVDVGTANPYGMGYVLEAQGSGAFSGTVMVSLH
jgi:hypothetical protein